MNNIMRIITKKRLTLEPIAIITISLIFGILILSGAPVNYIVGFLLAAFVGTVFIAKPLHFLIGLFLLRSVFDNFLRSVRISPGGPDVGLGGIIALGLVIGTVFYLLIHSKDLGRIRHMVVGLSSIFCLVSVASFFISLDRFGATKVLVRRFSVFSILLLTMVNIRSRDNARTLLKVIVLSAIMPLTIGAVKYIMEGGRFVGTFAHPNILAFYLLIIIGCTLTLVDSPRHYLSLIRKFCLGLLLTALLLTMTRSAWACCFLMIGIYASFFNKRLIVPAFCAVILITFLPIAQERILDIFATTRGSLAVDEMSSLGWRFRTWYYLFSEATKHPFIGHGINATAYIGVFPAEAHNDYLRFFVESGVTGVVAYYASYLYLIIYSLRNRIQFFEDDLIKKLSIFFICFVPAFLLMSASENLGRYLTVHWYFWGLIGIYLGLIALEKEKRNAIKR